jgi:type II secretory pathway component PulJ
LPNLHAVSRSVFQFARNGQKDQMGFLVALIAMVIVFALMLPLIGSIYYDTLAVQKESKMQIERMERLRQQLEQDRKDLDRMKNESK